MEEMPGGKKRSCPRIAVGSGTWEKRDIAIGSMSDRSQLGGSRASDGES